MNGGSDTTTQQSSVPDWVKPYATNYMDQSQKVAALPYKEYSGQTTAQMNPFESQGLNAQASRALNGSPVTDAASGELQRTLNGGYLGGPVAGNSQADAQNPYAGSNPFLTGAINNASQDVINNYQRSVVPQLDAMDARSGSFGNAGVGLARTAAASDLTKNLGNVASGMRFNDYTQQGQYGENAANRRFQAGAQYAGDTNSAMQNERQRMTGAVGMAPSIANQDYTDAQALQNAGKGFQQQDQANMTDAYGRFQNAQNYPKDQLTTLGRGLGMNFGTTSTGTGPQANPWAQALGAGLAGYGAYKSGSTSGGSK